MFTEVLELCLTHIERIENFPAGEEVPWPKSREARIAYLEDLDDDDVLEIGNEIWIKSSLTEAERTVAGESLPPAPTSA